MKCALAAPLSSPSPPFPHLSPLSSPHTPLPFTHTSRPHTYHTHSPPHTHTHSPLLYTKHTHIHTSISQVQQLRDVLPDHHPHQHCLCQRPGPARAGAILPAPATRHPGLRAAGAGAAVLRAAGGAGREGRWHAVGACSRVVVVVIYSRRSYAVDAVTQSRSRGGGVKKKGEGRADIGTS